MDRPAPGTLGEEYTVIEEGLCGRTAVFDDPLNEGMNGLAYLNPCLMSHSPIDYLIIMLGTNDCKERFSATPKNIADGMKRLIMKAKHTDAWRENQQILLLAPGPIEKACETSPVAGRWEYAVKSRRSWRRNIKSAQNYADVFYRYCGYRHDESD